MVSLLSEPFRWFEILLYSKRLSRVPLPESPVFILGHWRSGTTLLHNAMAQDTQFAYINTFQSVFTNQFFGSRWLFKPLMGLLMPEKRPADNVLLSPELPQEEGIALSNLNAFSFYNFFYFPRRWKAIYTRYVSGESATPAELKSFGKKYKKLIAQAMLEYNRPGFISKFPPNTGRIKLLLEMFPKAKFIYIYRDPVKVFKSTVNFFETTHEALKVQPYSRPEFEEMVFELYEKIITDYEQQKALIPEHHLVEIKYETFEDNPLDGLRHIYDTLQLDGFEDAVPGFSNYIKSQRRFEKANRSYSREEIARIADRWDFAFELYGYAKTHPDYVRPDMD